MYYKKYVSNLSSSLRGDQTVNIFTYLKKDHQKVSDLFKKIEASPGSNNNIAILEEIVNELTLHAETEQATFYKAINKTAKGKEEISHAKDEHKDIKKAISKVLDLKPNTSNWFIAFGELKAVVEHHVEEEETEIFSTARKILSKTRLESLTEEMEELKEEMTSELA